MPNFLVNILINGDFEDNTASFCPKSYNYCFETNSAIIAPWYVPCGSYNNIQVDRTLLAASGSWFLDLNSDLPYSIAQDVNLVVGKSYLLTFSVRIAPGINVTVPSQFTGTVQATGSTLRSFSANSTTWSDVTYRFTAIQKLTTITVASTTAGRIGPYVDKFSLYPSDTTVTPLASPSVNPLSASVSLHSSYIKLIIHIL